MLSRQELIAYGTSTLTPTFIDRIFEECLTYGGEMDYKTYLDFVLALENRKGGIFSKAIVILAVTLNFYPT